MKRIPVWLQTLLVAVFVIPLVFITVTSILRGADAPTSTTTTVAVVDTTTTTLPKAEIINGISVVFQTQSNAFRNDEIRETINKSVSALPEHLADEIREITVYVVDDAVLCAGRVPPPGKVIVGCADGDGGEWIELIINKGGYHPYVVVHEFGHIIGGGLTPWGTQRYASYFTDVYVSGSGDSPPTEYGNTYFTEDYADSFTLYVLYQDQLRQCCNDRYEYFKGLFEG